MDTDTGQPGQAPHDPGHGMAGPITGLGATVCLLAASFLPALEAGLRITALALACVASSLTIWAALRRGRSK